MDWPAPQDISEARALIGVCVYYRIWIEHFALLAAPIYQLFKKNVEFFWDIEQARAMDLLKFALTNPPALMTIDYTEGFGPILLSVNASLTG